MRMMWPTCYMLVFNCGNHMMKDMNQQKSPLYLFLTSCNFATAVNKSSLISDIMSRSGSEGQRIRRSLPSIPPDTSPKTSQSKNPMNTECGDIK